ncbi:hypothetical protein WR25_25956 [Diploscapter pachys]|uniref:Uncharacterized protein n=1 Tax=Diploscapter pachys TaxID=2018661 RepID=A0A2A2KSC9_9BILA|nr:hypothetical protein WR25_25956 [Diploscapter pachys]
MQKQKQKSNKREQEQKKRGDTWRGEGGNMRSCRNGSAECCVRDAGLGAALLLLLFIAGTLCCGLWMKV